MRRERLMSGGRQTVRFFRKILPMLALSAPLVLYCYYVLKYSVNRPYATDDDVAVLNFLNVYVQAKGLLAKLLLLFSQHAEHRIVLDRVVELAQYRLYGQVNFVQLIIIGNIGWLLAVYVLYREFRDYGLKTLYFFPVMYIMFDFSRWDPMTWAMASISLYFGFFFGLESLYVLLKRPGFGGFACSLFLLAMSMYTNGCGMTLVPVFFLALAGSKRYRELLVSLLVSAFLIFSYFYLLKYVRPSYNSAFYMKNPMGLVLFSLATLGNTYMGTHLELKQAIHLFNTGDGSLGNFMPAFYGAAVCGLLLIAVFAYLGAKGLYKRNGGFVFWAVVWIILTSLVIAAGRGGFGFQAALISRYTVLSALLTSFLYMAGLDFLKAREKTLKKLGLAVSAFALLLYASTFSPGTGLLKFRHNLLENPMFGYPSFHNPGDWRILQESRRLGIYRIQPDQ